MNKTSLTRTLLVAGVLAAAGIAQAETFDSPQQAGEASTMTGGSPNALTTNSPYADNTVIVDTRVLGAGPAVVVPYGTTYYGPTYYYSAPAAVVVQPGVQREMNSGVYSTTDSGSYYGN
jgi:hypothetical protein